MNKKTKVYLMFVLAIIITTLAIGNIHAGGSNGNNTLSYPHKIGPVGGPSTQSFDDFPAIPPQTPITKLVIASGDVIDSIQAFYGNTAMPKHGGDKGVQAIVNINPNDYITEISGCYGGYYGAVQIGQITIKTHLGKIYGPFGGAKVSNNQAFSLKTAGAKEQIIALFGGSFKHTDGTDYISALGAYITVYNPVYPHKIGPVGGPSTQSFDDFPAIPPQTPITKLVIASGDVIDSIQAFYGNTAMPKHGGDKGVQAIVNINPNDYITEISGCYGGYYGAVQIGQIMIKTHLGKTYGPFGGAKVSNNQAFSLKTTGAKEQIIALFGGSFKHTDGTNYISALGAYVR